MRRREFIALLGGAAAWPLSARAQKAARVPRVGVLTWERCLTPDSIFGLALRDFGYAWGQTVQVVCRSAEGDYARLMEAAQALAAENVDIIVALTHITAYAAHRATQSTPIVMIASGDPVKTGLVASLARPGGNVTGLTYYAAELVEKRLQLLKEVAPSVTRVAVLANAQSDHVFGVYRQDAERAADALGLELVRAEASQPRDLEAAFERIAADGAQGLVVLTDPMINSQAKRIAELAAQRRIPSVYWGPWFVEAGGLMAYSADFAGMTRRTAYFVDRILKGARPADLPVEQPTRFYFAINMKTAKALGIEVPTTILLRADQIIE